MGDSLVEIDYEDPPFPLTAIDREILAMKDDDFHRVTWEELRQIIANNALEQLKRVPSDLRRYLAWCYDIRNRYGTIKTYVIQEKLRWQPLASDIGTATAPTFVHHSWVPFADPRDYAVLINDWPYGLAPGITHLLVWSKTPIEVDADQGDVTPASRRVIDGFVNRYFVQHLGAGGSDRVMWFKNWVRLQSVRGVDHVHVLVKDVSDDNLAKWITRRDL